MTKQHFGNFITLCCAALLVFYIGIFTFVFGPSLETKVLPIVKDLEIHLISEHDGVMEFEVVAYKDRSCEVADIAVAVGEKKDGVLRRAHFSLKDAEGIKNRPLGWQVYSATIVAGPGINYVRVDTKHDCHVLWKTVSAPWGEWTRGGKQ